MNIYFILYSNIRFLYIFIILLSYYLILINKIKNEESNFNDLFLYDNNYA